jgi:hypothetical protein
MKINFDRIVIYPEREWTLNLLTNLLQCKICMNILNDPYDCTHCNQTFCKKCITNYINSNKKCPYDMFFKNHPKQSNTNKEKITNNIKPSSTNITKVINSIRLYCKYKKNGCNSEISIEQIKDHENNCPFKNQKLIKTKIIEEEKDKINELNKSKDEFVSGLLLKKLEEKSNNKESSKYKTQDSCVSFRKIDELDNNSLLLSPKENYSSPPRRTFSPNNTIIQKLNEKIDSIYNIIKNNNNINNITTNNNNNSFSNEINQLEQNEYDPQSTPKLGAKNINNKKHNNINSNLNNNSKSSSNIHIQKLLFDMQSVINKVQDIERLIQTNSSFQIQNYSIQSEENLGSPTSTYASTSTYYNTSSNSAYSSCLDIKKNDKFKIVPKNNLIKPTKNSIYNPMRNSNVNKVLCKKNSNSNKECGGLNNSVNNLNIMNYNLENNNCYEEIKDIFEKVVNDKFEKIKHYIDEKCIEELKKFYMDMTLDNTNLFAQKFDELQDLISNKK